MPENHFVPTKRGELQAAFRIRGEKDATSLG
jgi:hypothetical protein